MEQVIDHAPTEVATCQLDIVAVRHQIMPRVIASWDMLSFHECFQMRGVTVDGEVRICHRVRRLQ